MSCPSCPSCRAPLPPLLLNITEFAALIGESRWSAAARLRRFEVPFIPTGRKHKRIALTDAIAWMESRKVRNADEHRRALDGRRRGAR